MDESSWCHHGEARLKNVIRVSCTPMSNKFDAAHANSLVLFYCANMFVALDVSSYERHDRVFSFQLAEWSVMIAPSTWIRIAVTNHLNNHKIDMWCYCCTKAWPASWSIQAMDTRIITCRSSDLSHTFLSWHLWIIRDGEQIDCTTFVPSHSVHCLCIKWRGGLVQFTTISWHASA